MLEVTDLTHAYGRGSGAQGQAGGDPYTGGPMNGGAAVTFGGAPFKGNVSSNLREMTDGTSNTMLCGEVIMGINGTGGQSGTYPTGGQYGPYDHRGDLLNDDYNCTMFMTYTTPNSKIPDQMGSDTFCGNHINVALESIFVPEPVLRLSIEPMKRDGADRLSKALERFRREDPTFRVMTDQESGQTLIAGMGQLHLEIYIERIRREYKCECLIGEPKVAYRECITKPIEFNFRHKKQTGGSGQYAHIVGRIKPLAEDSPVPYEFVDEVFGGRIPREYIPAVDAGFQRALPKGPL